MPFVIDQPVPADVEPASVLADVDAFATRLLTVRLYHLELVPSYHDVLEACLRALPPDVVHREGGERARNGAIFFGTPGARVPAHVDRHHNLLLQVAGTKRVSVGFFSDPERQQREVERHVGPGRLQATALPEPAATFELAAGDGVYIPPYAFHWIEIGDEVSLSLSASWSTVVTDAALAAHEVNRRLRGLGLRPRPVGRSPRRDRIKAAALQARRRGRR